MESTCQEKEQVWGLLLGAWGLRTGAVGRSLPAEMPGPWGPSSAPLWGLHVQGGAAPAPVLLLALESMRLMRDVIPQCYGPSLEFGILRIPSQNLIV